MFHGWWFPMRFVPLQGSSRLQAGGQIEVGGVGRRRGLGSGNGGEFIRKGEAVAVRNDDGVGWCLTMWVGKVGVGVGDGGGGPELKLWVWLYLIIYCDAGVKLKQTWGGEHNDAVKVDSDWFEGLQLPLQGPLEGVSLIMRLLRQSLPFLSALTQFLLQGYLPADQHRQSLQRRPPPPVLASRLRPLL